MDVPFVARSWPNGSESSREATRGGGKAIALELGAAGWTVYVTGRSTRAAGTTENLQGDD
jgi:hypothetical protein